MGADATLVNMAYRAAMAKVPGDWSASFEKQYEGIIAANNAFANIGSQLAGAVGAVGESYFERVKEGEEFARKVFEAQELYKLGDGASTDLLTKTAADVGEGYNDGEGLNHSFGDAAYSVPEDIYSNIVNRNKKVFKNKKDKQYIAEQYARLESWKKDRIKDKANVKQLTNAINSDLVNLENMDPEYKTLLAQLINNKGDLASKGIRIYNRKSDDKLMIQFTPNRMEYEYEYNMSMKDPDVDESILPPIPPYSEETARVAGLQTVSFQDLMDNVNYKELELQNDVYEGVTGFDAIASAKHKGSKTFITAEWDDGTVNSGKAQATKLMRNLFSGKNQKHISDLATTDFFGTGSTYRDDLNGLVGQMDLSALGIEDKGVPGYEDDFARGDLAREEIVGRLINPKNPNDLKFAKRQMEDYYISMAEGVFKRARTAIEDSQVTVTGLTAKQIADQNKAKKEQEQNNASIVRINNAIASKNFGAINDANRRVRLNDEKTHYILDGMKGSTKLDTRMIPVDDPDVDQTLMNHFNQSGEYVSYISQKEINRERQDITDRESMIKLGGITKEKQGEMTKYFAGTYSSLKDANTRLKETKSGGFKDAFIFAELDGKRITMAKAKELGAVSGLEYKVQIKLGKDINLEMTEAEKLINKYSK